MCVTFWRMLYFLKIVTDITRFSCRISGQIAAPQAPEPIRELLFGLWRESLALAFAEVPSGLRPSEVAAANASVDAHAAEAVQASHRKGMARVPDGASLDDTSRWDYRGMLGWEPAESRAPFVNMLGHPKLTRYLNTICGKGFRVRRRLGPSLRASCRSLTSTSATIRWITARRSSRSTRGPRPAIFTARAALDSRPPATTSGKTGPCTTAWSSSPSSYAIAPRARGASYVRVA